MHYVHVHVHAHNTDIQITYINSDDFGNCTCALLFEQGVLGSNVKHKIPLAPGGHIPSKTVLNALRYFEIPFAWFTLIKPFLRQ